MARRIEETPPHLKEEDLLRDVGRPVGGLTEDIIDQAEVSTPDERGSNIIPSDQRSEAEQDSQKKES